EANVDGDPEAALIVFNAGWPLTMVGLDVGDRTLFTRAHLDKLRQTRGPENDFAAGVLDFIIALSEKYGWSGTPMYDPLAVGVTIDRSLVTTEAMRVDVETRGEFTRGETVANRHNTDECNVQHGDRVWIEGQDTVKPNARVSVAVQAERVRGLFIYGIAGK